MLIIYLQLHANRLVYIFAGILILIACLMWIFLQKKVSLDTAKIKSQPTFLLLNTTYFILFTGSILSIYLRSFVYERPLLYFIFLFSMISVVILEILLLDSENKKHVFLIIFQIIIVNLSIICSQFFIFPNILGLDPWIHQMVTSQIISKGFIPTGFNYSNLPIMHLEIATTSILTGLGYKLSAIFSIALIQILCGVLFVFLLGRYLFDIKIGLITSLLLVTSNYFINMGLFIIPNTIGAIFILIIIYLLFKINKEKFLIGTSLILFFMITLILTHTISSMCMAIILFIIVFFSVLLQKIFS